MFMLVDFSELADKVGAKVYIHGVTFKSPFDPVEVVKMPVVSEWFDIDGFSWGDPSNDDNTAIVFDEEEDCVRADNVVGDNLICINLLKAAPEGTIIKLDVDVAFPGDMDAPVYFSLARRQPKPDEWFLGGWGEKTGHVAEPDSGEWPGTQTITATLGTDCDEEFLLVDFSEVSNKEGASVYIRSATYILPDGTEQKLDYNLRYFDIGGVGWASPSDADVATVSFVEEENYVMVENVNGDDLVCINILKAAPAGTKVSLKVDVGLPGDMDGSVYFSFARRQPKPDEWFLGGWGEKTGHVAEPASGAWPGTQTVTVELGTDCDEMFMLVDFSELADKVGTKVYIREVTFSR